MRVIAGRYKGRRLLPPDWPGLRPTSDKLRETLFNILQGEVAGARVLDAFAGTGAVGIEALSRGAAHVSFVERDRRACALIEANLGLCGIAGGYTIARADLAAWRPAAGSSIDIAFLDPPYDAADLAALVTAAAGHLAGDGRLILELAAKRDAPEVQGLTRVRLVRSGDSALAFYRPPSPDIQR